MWIGRERDEGRARTFPAGGAATDALTRTVLRPAAAARFPARGRRAAAGTTAALAVIDEADMAGRKKRFLPSGRPSALLSGESGAACGTRRGSGSGRRSPTVD